MLTVKAPGKLYIAGEYAVVKSGHPALLVAVDQFVYAQIKASPNGVITSAQLPAKKVTWQHVSDQAQFLGDTQEFAYVTAALRFTERYLCEQGQTLKHFTLHFDSDLDSPDGKKYGLGSSAAVTVATVKAVAAFYGVTLTAMETFKLAALAHYSIQKNGSLGDIAASSFTGWLAYYSCDRSWLVKALEQYSLSELLRRPWPKLKIERLTPPTALRLLIGWTKTPASTAKLVDQVDHSKKNSALTYAQFLQASKDCVEKMIVACKADSLPALQAEIAHNRQLLQGLAQLTQTPIETPVLRALITSTKAFGGQAKTSGAGGGDCGIALVDKNLPYKELYQTWEKLDITPLPINVYTAKEGEVNG